MPMATEQSANEKWDAKQRSEFRAQTNAPYPFTNSERYLNSPLVENLTNAHGIPAGMHNWFGFSDHQIQIFRDHFFEQQSNVNKPATEDSELYTQQLNLACGANLPRRNGFDEEKFDPGIVTATRQILQAHEDEWTNGFIASYNALNSDELALAAMMVFPRNTTQDKIARVQFYTQILTRLGNALRDDEKNTIQEYMTEPDENDAVYTEAEIAKMLTSRLYPMLSEVEEKYKGSKPLIVDLVSKIQEGHDKKAIEKLLPKKGRMPWIGSISDTSAQEILVQIANTSEEVVEQEELPIYQAPDGDITGTTLDDLASSENSGLLSDEPESASRPSILLPAADPTGDAETMRVQLHETPADAMKKYEITPEEGNLIASALGKIKLNTLGQENAAIVKAILDKAVTILTTTEDSIEEKLLIAKGSLVRTNPDSLVSELFTLLDLISTDANEIIGLQILSEKVKAKIARAVDKRGDVDIKDNVAFLVNLLNTIVSSINND